MTGFTSKAQVDIAASPPKVWRALTDPDVIPRYFFGSRVTTDWKPGSAISWKGEWQGKPYEDKGRVLEVEPNQHLKFTHFSALSGAADKPENYHTIAINLSGQGQTTRVSLSQDNNRNEEEAEHSSQNWNQMLRGLKTTVESM